MAVKPGLYSQMTHLEHFQLYLQLDYLLLCVLHDCDYIGFSISTQARGETD